MQLRVKFLSFLLFMSLLAVLPVWAQQQQFQSQTINVSGQSITITNTLAATNGTFGYVIQGSPNSISIVLAGCTSANSCSTLDTYTAVFNTTRTPTLSQAYDHFTVTATWSGGTSPSVTVNSTLIVPAGGGGSGNVSTTGSPATGNLTKFSGANTITNADLAGDVTTSGTTTTTVGAVNGVTHSASPSVHQVAVVTASNTATYKTIPDCQDSAGNHINYTQSTDIFTCGSTSSGGSFTFPVTVAGTTTSGGIPYFSATTTLSSSGLLTSNAPVLGGGAGAAPKVSTGITSNGASQLTLGIAGGAAGVIALAGSTSGSCTLTDNATSTLVTSSCSHSIPALSLTAGGGELSLTSSASASQPNISNATSSTYGIAINSTTVSAIQNNVIMWGNAIANECGSSNNNCMQIPNTFALSWPSGAIFGSSDDLGISRIGAATLGVGNGAQGDETATIRAANACRVTTDIVLPVNTATTVCTWSLPAIAKAWAWQCEIPWVISAGTGTNTLAIVANASQTPTAGTNGFAEILTTNTGTATEATTAISASGGTTLLTSGTITPSATVFSARTSGTVLASATAGTFSIQMTAAGTTATAAAKAGATCLLY